VTPWTTRVSEPSESAFSVGPLGYGAGVDAARRWPVEREAPAERTDPLLPVITADPVPPVTAVADRATPLASVV